MTGCRLNWQLALAMSLALSLAGGAAQAAIVKIVFDGQQPFKHRFEVAPDKFAEACGELPRGSVVQWRFTASAPLNFNIHFHEGKAVTYPVRQDSVGHAEGRLQIESDEAHCWMWTNRTSQPATVDVQLTR